jgi:hypothetical protein
LGREIRDWENKERCRLVRLMLAYGHDFRKNIFFLASRAYSVVYLYFYLCSLFMADPGEKNNILI